MNSNWKLYCLIIFSLIIISESKYHEPRPHHSSSYTSLRDCFNLLENWSTLPNAFEYFYFSGKNWNDFGLWDQCNRDPLNRYVKLKFVNRTRPEYPFRLGLCVPKECSASDIQVIAPWFAKRIGKQVGYDFSTFDLFAYDPNLYVAHLGSGSSAFYAIFIISIILCILSACTMSIYSTKRVDNLGRQTSFNESVHSHPSQKGSQAQAIGKAREQFELAENQKDQPLLGRKQKRGDSSSSGSSVDEDIVGQKRHSMEIKLVDSFHFQKNFDRIYESPDHKKESLHFLDGVRALSLGYIIWGQEYLVRWNIATNPEMAFRMLSEPIALLVRGATFATDAFFWLSGFFFVLSCLSGERKKSFKSGTGYIGAIIYRYLRIMPAYGVCLLFFTYVLKRFGEGPNWYMLEYETHVCEEVGWRNLLLVDNLYNDGKKCFKWGWYLACDSQLFLVALVILALYKASKSCAKFVIWVLIGVSLLYSLVLVSYEGWTLFPLRTTESLLQLPEYMSLYFEKPWTRAPSYLFGLWVGFCYVEFKKCEKKIVKRIERNENQESIDKIERPLFSRVKQRAERSAITNIMYYVFGIGLILLVIKGPASGLSSELSGSTTVFFLTFERLLFVIGMFLCLLPSLLGFETLLRNLLQIRQFVYISRLSYTMFLLHGIVLLRSYYHSKIGVWYRQFTLIYWAIADTIWIWLASNILAVCIEWPLLNVIKLFAKGKKTTTI